MKRCRNILCRNNACGCKFTVTREVVYGQVLDGTVQHVAKQAHTVNFCCQPSRIEKKQSLSQIGAFFTKKQKNIWQNQPSATAKRGLDPEGIKKHAAKEP
jgi:hypothetical protein